MCAECTNGQSVRPYHGLLISAGMDRSVVPFIVGVYE